MYWLAPQNLFRPEMSVGLGISIVALVFSSSAFTPSLVILCLWNVITFSQVTFLSSFRMIFACLHLEYSSFNLSCLASEVVSSHQVTMTSPAIVNTLSMSPSASVSFLWKISLETFHPNGSLDHLYPPNGVIIVVNMLDQSSSFTCQYASLMSNC